MAKRSGTAQNKISEEVAEGSGGNKIIVFKNGTFTPMSVIVAGLHVGTLVITLAAIVDRQ